MSEGCNWGFMKSGWPTKTVWNTLMSIAHTHTDTHARHYTNPAASCHVLTGEDTFKVIHSSVFAWWPWEVRLKLFIDFFFYGLCFKQHPIRLFVLSIKVWCLNPRAPCTNPCPHAFASASVQGVFVWRPFQGKAVEHRWMETMIWLFAQRHCTLYV